MTTVTLVTAFFPISREQWSKFAKSTQNYLDYFKFWARIKNDLIIYTSPDMVEPIRTIRNSFGDRTTKIIGIKNLTTKEPKIYKMLQGVASQPYSKNFRLTPDNPECWNVDYNFVMHMKYWFMQDASRHLNDNEMLAWIDFGYNHGGEYYLDSEQFAFLWEPKLSPKIHLFLKHELTNDPIFDICRRMDTYVQGSLVVGPANLWQDLYPIYKREVESLADVGLMDDDQTVLLMCYRKKPEIFEIHNDIKAWHSQIQQTCDIKFKVAEHKKNNMQKFRTKFGHKKRCLFYALKTYKHLSAEEIKY